VESLDTVIIQFEMVWLGVCFDFKGLFHCANALLHNGFCMVE